jgi:hypothetical protein
VRSVLAITYNRFVQAAYSFVTFYSAKPPVLLVELSSICEFPPCQSFGHFHSVVSSDGSLAEAWVSCGDQVCSGNSPSLSSKGCSHFAPCIEVFTPVWCGILAGFYSGEFNSRSYVFRLEQLPAVHANVRARSDGRWEQGDHLLCADEAKCIDGGQRSMTIGILGVGRVQVAKTSPMNYETNHEHYLIQRLETRNVKIHLRKTNGQILKGNSPMPFITPFTNASSFA